MNRKRLTKRHRANISKGLRKTYRDRPEALQTARENAARASEKARELYILGQNSKPIDQDNQELQVRVEVLTSQLRTAEAKHTYQAKRIRQLEIEAIRYWELYQAALGPVKDRGSDL